MQLRERRRPGNANGQAKAALDALTPSQRGALASLGHLGWHLSFVRHPLFQAPEVVIHDETGVRVALLEADGTVNERHPLRLRA